MKRTHGKSQTPEYRSWQSMKARCENLNNQDFWHYKDRNISVSEEFHSFEIWFSCIGPKPGPGFTQDRVNNKEGYKRGNVKWSTRKEQTNNSSNLKWFYGHGPTGEMIIEKNQTKVAETFRLNRGHISACLRKKLKQHKGWKFQWLQKTNS